MNVLNYNEIYFLTFNCKHLVDINKNNLKSMKKLSGLRDY